MAWDDREDNPWGGGKRGSGQGQGPPDLDAALNDLLKRFSGIFNMGTGGRPGKKMVGGGLLVLLAVLVGGYFLLGLYTLDQQERGVILRFGALQTELQMPGLRWNPPIIDEVVIVNVTRINNIRHQALMLTKDENIVDVTMSVQYLIAEPSAYTVAVRSPRQSLEHASESALRHVVGSSSMDSVLTEGRQQVANEVEERLQRYMNLYRTGIQVVKVNIDNSQPPSQVAAAFDDVQAAQEDNQRLINEANSYLESIVPQARGEARKQIEQATAYRDQVIARAEGEADRFSQLLKEYHKAKGVTRDRLYLDAMESIFASSTKVMVDVEGGNNLLYLPLDQLLKDKGSVDTIGQTTLSTDDVRRIADAVLRDINNRSTSNRRESR